MQVNIHILAGMATVRKPTAERRSEIADAALRIVGTRGLPALTVSSLAADLGITGGALYRHFASTDEILVAVAVRVAELLDASLPEPSSLPPMEWLDRFARSRTETVGGHAGLARLLLSEQLAMALPEAALDHLRGCVKRTAGTIVRVLAAAQAAGEIRTDLEPEALAPVVMGTLQMIAMHRAGSMLPRFSGNPMRPFETLRVLLQPTGEARRT